VARQGVAWPWKVTAITSAALRYDHAKASGPLYIGGKCHGARTYHGALLANATGRGGRDLQRLVVVTNLAQRRA